MAKSGPTKSKFLQLSKGGLKYICSLSFPVVVLGKVPKWVDFRQVNSDVLIYLNKFEYCERLFLCFFKVQKISNGKDYTFTWLSKESHFYFACGVRRSLVNFSQDERDCYWNVDRMFRADQKWPYLHASN